MAKKKTTVKKVLLAISVGVLLPLMAWGISSKISELTALTSLAGNDLFVVVDTSETETKKIARSDLVGIADNDLVEIDDSDAADNDYAKLTANGIEGRSYAEVKADLSLEIGTDVLAEQAIGIADNNLVEVDGPGAGAPASGEYAKWTASGIEGKTVEELKTDASLNNVENTAHSTDSHTMTIDGRDVSVDGTKLDGIASGADVTGNNAPQAHKASHQNTGGDEVSVVGLSGLLADDQHVLDAEVKLIKLDDFATPDDNTDLNASTSAHGLLKKLDNVATNYMDGQGNWSVPAAASYGVRWDEDLSSPTLIRTGTLAAFATGSSPGNSNMPVHASMRRVILNDAGVRQYYLCSTDSTKKENCSDASVLDGTDGQVMVEIRKFFYRYTYDSFDNVHDWSIAYTLLVGFEPHPAFYKDGAWVDYRYIGAYEGIGWDNSVGAYIDHGNTAATGWSGTTIDTANDKLSSVSGKNPITDETRDEFRSIALNRGSGWRQQDFYLVSAIQLLYLIEYASFCSQCTIGMGRTELTAGAWVNGSYISEGGLSNGDGNGTNSVAYSGDADDAGAEAAYMTYRGIEGFFGNIGDWVDGFNINGNIPYVSNTETDFADDTTTAYTRLEDTGGSGITLHSADGYQTTLEQTKGGFLPSAVGGGSNTYITDYYWQDTGWRVVKLGANANSGLVGGFFAWALFNASSADDVYAGSRLAY